MASRPSRGAWIEMLHLSHTMRPGASRAPRGARGLKSCQQWLSVRMIIVAPLAGRVD